MSIPTSLFLSPCCMLTKKTDNQRPCEQCTKRGKQQTCIDGNHKQFKYLRDSEYHPTRRRRSQDGTGDGSEGSSPECIDPVLLHAQENPDPRENATTELPREKSTSTSSSQKARQDLHALQPLQTPRTSSEACESPEEDIFEDILAELLAYDTTKPPSFLNMPGYDEHESKSNGFSISTGWSSTFFPPGLEVIGRGV
ncbi:hypothetical protein BJX62DRAFT_211356 [Aspergillus germanicus]